ncbi:MAG TPA: enoyl-CoA hydratase-related protein [Chloroflexota bacterium]|jgi:enoyl-CoA hydratase/carnithine racemase
MSLVQTERGDGVMLIRMNRPERLNALGTELRLALAEAWCEFRESRELEVAIYTGTGRAFCVGEDMKESVERQALGSAASPRPPIENPYTAGTLDKPVIAAVNGFAMGGGFMEVERADLRVAVRGAIFEMSEAKRWLLGGYYHGFVGGLSHAVATEMAFAFRFTAERLHELGFINRLVDDAELLPTAREMAGHLLTLPPAARVNTLAMMRAMRPRVPDELTQLANRLREHGAKDDLMESRRAFAEKRPPRFKGWDDPEDRYRTPTLESVRRERAGEG